jgi:hypothetical protein
MSERAKRLFTVQGLDGGQSYVRRNPGEGVSSQGGDQAMRTMAKAVRQGIMTQAQRAKGAKMVGRAEGATFAR